uniref:Toxin TdNa3 n=1 Tax=Tityus discrepans TaxID=57059 RepID=SCNA3_TITDI|nr:RecName: Full=Toxin TdNa3; AltName: Full=PT-Arthr*-beta* NaTx2.4; Flags: Precursor [Tityus discrepans]CAY61931.1 putative neurotoxin Na3 precursor [Tityus discrepans]
MKGMIMLISCLMLIDVVVESKNGYIIEPKGCKYSCSWGSSTWCNRECKFKKGSSGYCAWPACWCYGLPDNVKIFDYYNNKCGK